MAQLKIGLLDLINSNNFLIRMKKKWQDRNLATSKALQDSWLVLCETLNNHASGEVFDTWSVVPLPTGAGKTEGLISYCVELSMSASCTGVLIVTRFTDEADRIVSGINLESGQEIAISQHSKIISENKRDALNLKQYQVLVITHAAYKKLLALSSSSCSDLLKTKYTEWDKGVRIVVVDEALCLDEKIEISFDDIRIARNSIPLHIERKYPLEINYLDMIIQKFFELTKGEKRYEYISKDFWYDAFREKIDIAPLINALDTFGDMLVINSFGKTSVKINKSFRKEVINALDDVTLLEGFYRNQNGLFLLNAVQLLLPKDIPNAVILDATAKINMHYSLLGDFVKFVDIPDDIRDYSNVHLKIIYGLSVGKGSMSSKDKDFFNGLSKRFFSELSVSETLFCVHKNNREKVEAIIGPLNKSNVAHWGNLDGKNDWASLRNMVIMGLPYLGQGNAECVVFSLSSWIRKTEYRYHESLIQYDDYFNSIEFQEPPDDMWKDYEYSYIAVRVIQALNRVRCRKSIDSHGGCDSVDMILFLGKKNGLQSKLQTELLSFIKTSMPNIMISEQEEDFGLGEKEGSGVTPAEAQFLDILKNLDEGEHLAKDIKMSANNIGISDRSVRRFLKLIKEATDTNFVQIVNDLGIKYVSVRGKYGNSRYIKTTIKNNY